MGLELGKLPADLQKKMARRAGIRQTASKEKIVRLAAEAVRAVAQSEEPLPVQRRALAMALKWIGR